MHERNENGKKGSFTAVLQWLFNRITLVHANQKANDDNYYSVTAVTVTAVTKIEKSLDMPSSFSILNQ